MKVLWFTNTPSLYDQGKHSYHGGGWIESLEQILRDQNAIELAVSFFHSTESKKIVKNNTTYYPVLRQSAKRNPVKHIINSWIGSLESEEEFIPKFLDIIEDFKPDVIHVFGTEGCFASVKNYTKIPVLIHLQGLINPCLNAYFPPGFSKWSFLFNLQYLRTNLIGRSPFFGYKRFTKQGERELQFLNSCQFFTGRTDWDESIIRLFNKDAKYFHVDEVLRPIFYEISSFNKSISNKKFIILSTLSPTIYKGIDVVLKTAQKLKEQTDLDYEWRIIGLESESELLRFFQRKVGVDCESVQIKLLGKMSPDQMIDQMLESDVFVHPSYIDNSPNSVCEAQMIGLPTIACNVGGISSLIEHKVSGILIPSNGVFELVYYLKLLSKDNELKSKLGEKGKEKARLRHQKERIVEKLVEVYREIY